MDSLLGLNLYKEGKMSESLVVLFVLAVIIIVLLVKTAVVVPQRSEYIVERLGKYSKTLSAGFHILIPFLDKIHIQTLP